ncbi:MAG: O-methyltransferase [Marinifilaceae bacterium]|jgi:predicted O-methyltransferase YrrM|nr:O-methyltransferase [Marinifilaceae bacterium]
MLEINKDLEEYIENHSQAESDVLKELDRETHLRMLRPRMLSGHIQGTLLKMLCKMIKPKRILEIGTYTGYSAISMGLAVDDNCIIDTIEFNDELEDFILKFVHKAQLEDKIRLHIGPALEIIPDLNEKYDMVFIDADKREYTKYAKLILPKLNSDGYILADDVLWDGKVIEEIDEKDLQTKGILEFNKFIQENTELENILLPIRHGLMIARKI